MKGRLNDLWWTTMLPWNFLLSAVAVGLAMTSVEAILSGWVLKHPVSLKLLRQLLKGNLGLAFTGSFAATFFLLEVAGGVLLPMLLLFLVGKSKAGILLGQSLVIAGILFNRLNVAFFTQAQDGAMYMPSLTEFLLSFGVVAGAILLFKAGAVYLPIFTPAKS